MRHLRARLLLHYGRVFTAPDHAVHCRGRVRAVDWVHEHVLHGTPLAYFQRLVHRDEVDAAPGRRNWLMRCALVLRRDHQLLGLYEG